MLGDFQRHLQFLGFRPESDVEYLSQPLAYLSPEGAFDGESLNGQPMVFRAGSATELGEFGVWQRFKPGHIAASDPGRTSYKPAFLRGAVAEEKFGPPFIVSKRFRLASFQRAPYARSH